MLSLGNVAGAPHLAEARKHEVHGVGAEDAQHKVEQRWIDAEGAQLYLPAHGAEYMRAYADGQSEANPTEMTFGADKAPHLAEIEVAEQQPAQPDAYNDGHAEFEQPREPPSLVVRIV